MNRELLQNPTLKQIDASKLNTYLTCPRKFFFSYVLGWRPEGESHDLVFGTSWHAAMEQLLLHGYNSTGIDAAFTAFQDEYRKVYTADTDLDWGAKTPTNALLALTEYAAQYKHDNFKVIKTECGGSVPFDEDFNLFFRLDNILTNENDQIFSLEHKTGSIQANWWADQWSLALQPNLYIHVLMSLYAIEKVYGVKVNGTFFLKQGTAASKQRGQTNSFLRVPVRKTLAQMQTWYENTLEWMQCLKNDFHRLEETPIEAHTMQCFPKNTNNCVQYMKMCMFQPLCANWSNPLQKIDRPPLGFVVKHWNPLDYQTKEIIQLKPYRNQGEQDASSTR